MIYLDPPAMRVKDTLTATCTGIRDVALKKRLLARESDLSLAEEEYFQAADNNDLFAFAQAAQTTEQSTPDPDGEELRKLYSDGLVGRKDGRVKYNELKARARLRRCLLCGAGEISSLDHHLPKKSLPRYAICPANLVPACNTCNLAKGDRIGTTANERTLHPYYDRPDEAGRYLIAEVSGWPVQFRILPLPGWSSELAQRVASHFRIFDLAKRFAEFSVSEVVSKQWDHRDLLGKGGVHALVAHLREDAEQHVRTHGPNAWGTALRYGLACSDWYVNHGVNEDM